MNADVIWDRWPNLFKSLNPFPSTKKSLLQIIQVVYWFLSPDFHTTLCTILGETKGFSLWFRALLFIPSWNCTYDNPVRKGMVCMCLFLTRGHTITLLNGKNRQNLSNGRVVLTYIYICSRFIKFPSTPRTDKFRQQVRESDGNVRINHAKVQEKFKGVQHGKLFHAAHIFHVSLWEPGQMRTTPCETVLSQAPHHINHPRAAAFQSLFFTHFLSNFYWNSKKSQRSGLSWGCINCPSLSQIHHPLLSNICIRGKLPWPHLWASWQSINTIQWDSHRWYILGFGTSAEYYLACDGGSYRYK